MQYILKELQALQNLGLTYLKGNDKRSKTTFLLKQYVTKILLKNNLRPFCSQFIYLGQQNNIYGTSK